MLTPFLRVAWRWGDTLKWAGGIALGAHSLLPAILPPEDSVGFSIVRLGLACIYCSCHAQGLLAVVPDVCVKPLGRVGVCA